MGGGLGIGLTLVNRLVLAQGGTVEASSAGVGAGSEFVVKLPLSATPALAAAPPPLAQQARPARRHRILIADDNQEAARSLAMVLSLAGHETSVVADGRLAVDAAERIQPTAAILDIAMPEVDGLAAARALRARAEGRPLLLMALSGFGSPSDRARSLEAGFDAHLVKPLELDRIEALLSEAPGIAGNS